MMRFPAPSRVFDVLQMDTQDHFIPRSATLQLRNFTECLVNCGRIRHEIFSQELRYYATHPSNLELDSHDSLARHVLVRVAGVPAAYCRLLPARLGQYARHFAPLPACTKGDSAVEVTRFLVREPWRRSGHLLTLVVGLVVLARLDGCRRLLATCADAHLKLFRHFGARCLGRTTVRPGLAVRNLLSIDDDCTSPAISECTRLAERLRDAPIVQANVRGVFVKGLAKRLGTSV